MHARVKFRHRARLSTRCALFRMTAIFEFPCVNNWILRFISINTVIKCMCKQCVPGVHLTLLRRPGYEVKEREEERDAKARQRQREGSTSQREQELCRTHTPCTLCRHGGTVIYSVTIFTFWCMHLPTSDQSRKKVISALPL